MTRSIYISAVFLLCNLLAACGTDTGSGDHSFDSDGARSEVTVSQSADAGEQEGAELSLRLTDAPIDNAVRVVLTFIAVEMKQQGGGWVKYTFDTPQAIDILQYHGTATADLLENVPIEPAVYKRIRLFVSANPMDNFIELRGGGVQPLLIPGGSARGLTLRGNFNIQKMQPARFIIDIDLRQSIRQPGGVGPYRMDLVYRVERTNNVGHIRGTIDSQSLLDPSCSDNDADTFNAIYVFRGKKTVPADINQLNNLNKDPVLTSPIRYDSKSGTYLYEAAYLRAGKYVVAFTCNADLENLEADDDLKFFDQQVVKVLVNDTVFLRN